MKIYLFIIILKKNSTKIYHSILNIDHLQRLVLRFNNLERNPDTNLLLIPTLSTVSNFHSLYQTSEWNLHVII